MIDRSHHLVASRAFASLPVTVERTRGALAEDGVWMAMQARPPAVDDPQLPPDVELFHVEQLQVPELAAARCLAWMRLKKRASAHS